ncbi:MAG: phosphatidylglycerophosphatase A [Alphaproteobacteria bacterium]|nr:phosphatidylglycerophosphatase A [Alphaproteobacteria bacterium]
MKKITFNEEKICKLITSLGGIGKLPASGTWGSLVALPFAWWFVGTPALHALALIAFIIGVITISPLIKNKPETDPSYVIIDEFMGQLVVFSLISRMYMTPILLIFGFLFFRLFDILKPWPASFFDKKVHNAWGVMLDDFVAAIYGFLALDFLELISYYL